MENGLNFVIMASMNKTKLKDRVIALEAEVKFLRKTAVEKPDFSVDDMVWKKVGPFLKKTRMKTYKKVYG